MLTVFSVMILNDLEKLKDEFSLEELVEQAARLIEVFVPKQERYKVTDYPDSRTIRFYTTRGLMDKPSRYKGQQAIYSQKHLLQLIVIKYLQSQYLSIKKISGMIKSISHHELIKIINIPENEDIKVSTMQLIPPIANNTAINSTVTANNSIRLNGEEIWNHYIIVPGFELHIRHDFVPESMSHVEALINLVRAILRKRKSSKGVILCQ